MTVLRKILIAPYVSPLATGSTLRVIQPDNPFVWTTSPSGVTGSETDERIAADAALQANINTETTARISADNTLQTNINTEASTRASVDSTLQTNINNEATARANADAAEATTRAAGDTAAHFATLDLSGLPTSDPGGGRVWLNAGNLHVGP